MLIILLSEDRELKQQIIPHFKAMLKTYSYKDFRYIYGLFLLEEIYYSGVVQGLW